MRHAAFRAVAALAASCVACGDARTSDAVPRAPTEVPAGSTVEGVLGDGVGAAAGPRRLRLLTDRQHANAIRDLLPVASVLPVETPGRHAYAFVDDAESLRVTGPLAFQVRLAAEDAAAQAVRRLDALLHCPAGADAACVERFVVRFASRAFRRPLDDAEVAALMSVYRDGAAGGLSTAVALVIQAVLQAPSFLYRAELGEPPAAGASRVALTPYEIAAQISFLFLDSIPDAPLWAAAGDGSLAAPEVIAAQVDRLLVEPRVRENLVRVVLAWLGVARVRTVVKEPLLYPDFDAGLRESMYAETERLVDRVMWRERGTLGDLLTSPRSEIDQRLALYYGVDIGHDTLLAAVELPSRAGVLTQPSLMASLAREWSTSVVRRGLFVNDRLLCRPAPPPPPPEALAKIAAAGFGLTERQFASLRAADPACASCHAAIDPTGLVFERYDAAGRYRSEEQGATIDTHATVAGIGEVVDAVDLARKLAESPEVRACFSSHMLRYALGGDVDGEAWVQDDIATAFENAGGDLVALFRAIATSDALRFRRAGASEAAP